MLIRVDDGQIGNQLPVEEMSKQPLVNVTIELTEVSQEFLDAIITWMANQRPMRVPPLLSASPRMLSTPAPQLSGPEPMCTECGGIDAHVGPCPRLQ
jgi:hypothetical protein